MGLILVVNSTCVRLLLLVFFQILSLHKDVKKSPSHWIKKPLPHCALGCYASKKISGPDTKRCIPFTYFKSEAEQKWVEKLSLADQNKRNKIKTKQNWKNKTSSHSNTIGIIPLTLIIDRWNQTKQKIPNNYFRLWFQRDWNVCAFRGTYFVLLNCCSSLHASVCMSVRSLLCVSGSHAMLLHALPNLYHQQQHHHHHCPSGGIRESPAAPASLHKANKIKFALLNQSMYGIPGCSLRDKLLQTASFVS